MRRNTMWTTVTVALSLLAPVACSKDVPTRPAVPVPGTLVVSLDAVDAPLGAALLILRGGGIAAPVKTGATEYLFARALDSTGTALQVAVIGNRVSGALFSFRVPDIARVDDYSVTLLQLADQSNAVLPGVAGYRLSLVAER